MSKTAQEWANTAIDGVQSACNLSGVAHSFSQLMTDLHDFSWDARFGDNPRNHLGTDWCNQHPLVVLFVDKMASLCGTQSFDSSARFAWAYDWAKRVQLDGGDFEYVMLKEDAA